MTKLKGHEFSEVRLPLCRDLLPPVDSTHWWNPRDSLALSPKSRGFEFHVEVSDYHTDSFSSNSFEK